MRLGVIDIGSNTVHAAVLDATRGTRPVPAASQSHGVRLMRYLEDDGSINTEGIEALEGAVRQAANIVHEKGADHLIVIATSALREATNGAEVLDDLAAVAGAPIEVLSGDDEARITFLAARRWYGWGAGRLLLLDIGGGSLEIAVGDDEEPEVALSLPLGAGRLTKRYLWETDPPSAEDLAMLREHVRHTLGGIAGYAQTLKGDHAVATSKTFRSLARLAGMPRHVVGAGKRYRLTRSQLEDWVPRLAKLSSVDRTVLPGIGERRSRQIVAGAVVAEETLRSLRVKEVEICPWALREGVILRHLEQL